MLILSRNVDQEIVIGEGPNQVVVKITDVRGDRVRVGIQAAPHVPVHRREVYEAIKERLGNGSRD